MYAAPPPDYFIEAQSSDEEELITCNRFHNLAEALVESYDDRDEYQKDVYSFYNLDEKQQVETVLMHDIFNQMRPKPWRDEKNLAKADALRLKANECYRSHKLKKALKFFNESLMYVPTSESMKYSKTTECEEDARSAIANVYFNRGLALFRLERFQDCLMDLERAFSYGHAKFYAKESLMVLFKCYLRTSRLSEAESMIANTDDPEAAGKYRLLLQRRIEADRQRFVRHGYLSAEMALNTLKTARAVEDMNNHILRNQEMLAAEANSNTLKFGQGNGLFPYLSNAVEYEFNAQQGRCFKAARDIQPGEVLVDEPPYCISLMPEHWKLRCLHCCKATDNPIACDTCAMVVFCHERCKEAEAPLHGVECPMMGNIKEASKTKIGSLAVRILLKAGLKTLLANRHMLEDLTEAEARTGFILAPITGQHYLDVCTLVTHKENWSPHLLFHAALYVAFHIHLLKMVRFFEPEMVFTESEEVQEAMNKIGGSGDFSTISKPTISPTSEFHTHPSSGSEYPTTSLQNQQSTSSGYDSTTWDRMVYVGRMMLRHLLALRSNRFGIDENAYRIGDTNNEPMLIARAVSVTGMVLNHSCEYKAVYTMIPSTGRIVFKAVVPIKRGEEVTHCYTCSYATAPPEERRKFLAPYFFECQCQACTENWGTVFDAMEQQICSIFVCPLCRNEINCHENTDQMPSGHNPEGLSGCKWDWSSSSSSTVKTSSAALDSSTGERDEKGSSDGTESTLDDVSERLERLELANMKGDDELTKSDSIGGAGDTNLACPSEEKKEEQFQENQLDETQNEAKPVGNPEPQPQRRPFYAAEDQSLRPEETTCRYCNYNASKEIKELKLYWYEYDDAMKIMSSGDTEAARVAVERYMAKLHEVVSPRSLEYITAAENLKKIYMRQGHSRAVDPMEVDWDDSSDEEEKPHPVFSYESPLF